MQSNKARSSGRTRPNPAEPNQRSSLSRWSWPTLNSQAGHQNHRQWPAHPTRSNTNNSNYAGTFYDERSSESNTPMLRRSDAPILRRSDEKNVGKHNQDRSPKTAKPTSELILKERTKKNKEKQRKTKKKTKTKERKEKRKQEEQPKQIASERLTLGAGGKKRTTWCPHITTNWPIYNSAWHGGGLHTQGDGSCY